MVQSLRRGCKKERILLTEQIKSLPQAHGWMPTPFGWILIIEQLRGLLEVERKPPR